MWTVVYRARHVPPPGSRSGLSIRPSPVGRDGGGGMVQEAVEPRGVPQGG